MAVCSNHWCLSSVECLMKSSNLQPQINLLVSTCQQSRTLTLLTLNYKYPCAIYNTGFHKSNITFLYCIHIFRPSLCSCSCYCINSETACNLHQGNIFLEKLKYCKTVRRRLKNILPVRVVKAHGAAEVYLHSVLALDKGQRPATRPGLLPPITYLTRSHMVSGVCLESFQKTKSCPCQESNYDSNFIQLVTQSLYRLSYIEKIQRPNETRVVFLEMMRTER